MYSAVNSASPPLPPSHKTDTKLTMNSCPLKLTNYFSTLDPGKPCKIPSRTPIRPAFSSSHHPTQPKIRAIKPKVGSSYAAQKSKSPVLGESEGSKYTAGGVEFKTLGGCRLGIGRYPDFVYDAAGGIGIGNGEATNSDDGDISVCFDLEQLYIPAMTSSTTKFLGLPLPPLLKIDIVPEFFQGNINRVSGKVELEFKAKFLFSVGTVYKAPPLMVATTLTSEESEGKTRRGRGKRLDNKSGECRLVGVAKVDPIDDLFMNTFLGLPTECLADLNAAISVSEPS